MSESPRFFGVRGHVETQAALARAIDRDRLHHAMIIVGPPGVGKATLARGLACALHCEQAPGRGCGTCRSCQQVISGSHGGVEWIEPAQDTTTIKIATARELANRLQRAPFVGTRHVVIFDPAEALGEPSYNALLKSLEEPRPGVHFVMLATGLDALLPTILSRCLALRVGRLESRTVREILDGELEQGKSAGEPPKSAGKQAKSAGKQAKSAGKQAKNADEPPKQVSEANRDLAVRLSDGSAGLAVKLALDPTLPSAVALVAQLVQAAHKGPEVIFGGDQSPLWTQWSEAVGPGATGRPARERATARRSAELWLLHLRERLRGRNGLPGVPPGTGDSQRLLRHLDRVQALLEGLARNPNVRLALEQTLLEM